MKQTILILLTTLFIWSCSNKDITILPEETSKSEYEERTEFLFNNGMDTLGLYKAIQNKNYNTSTTIKIQSTNNVNNSNQQKTDKFGNEIYIMPNGESKVWVGDCWINPQ